MITTSHAIYSLFLYRATHNKLYYLTLPALSALIGGIVPDIITYIFYLYYRFFQGVSSTVIWDSLYFNSPWSPFITLSHSFILWTTIIFFAVVFTWPLLRWLAIGALFHTVVDFFVHNEDAYANFWPLSNWRFESPISYWDPNLFGLIVSRFDAIFVIIILIIFYKEIKNIAVKIGIIGLIIFYLFMSLGPHTFIH